MAGFLGADFDPNIPEDGDPVKEGAWHLRDIKRRLQAFLAGLFNLETGNLKDNVIHSDALQAMSPTPAGVWRQVTVNSKGLVTSGQNPTISYSYNIYRAYMVGGTGAAPYGAYETETGFTELTPGAPVSYDPGTDTIFTGTYAASTVVPFSFVVPSGVTRVRVVAQGGGADDQDPAPECREASFRVAPGQIMYCWVGCSGTDGGPTRVAFGSGASAQYVEAGGIDSGGLTQEGLSSADILSMVYPGGDWGDAPATGLSGFVYLEWIK